jgi:Flp pilus assembly protein TadD
VELYMAVGREDEGQQLAEQLAHSQPDDANVHVMLARVCMHRDHMSRAFRVLQQAIAINPTHAGAQYHSAVALMSVDPPRIEEALACAEQAKAFGHPEARDLIQAIQSAKAPEA